MMPHWQRLFIKQHRAVRYLADLFGVGIIAQLAILPLSLYYFNQFLLLFWVSNLVLVPYWALSSRWQLQQLALVSFHRYIQHMISLTAFLMRIKIPTHGLRNGNIFLLKASLSDILMQHFWEWLLLACLSCCLALHTKRCCYWVWCLYCFILTC